MTEVLLDQVRRDRNWWREQAKDWEAVVSALLDAIGAPPIEATEPWAVGPYGELIEADAGPLWIEGNVGDDPTPRQVQIGADSGVGAALVYLRGLGLPRTTHR